jgi:hypothetical protein
MHSCTPIEGITQLVIFALYTLRAAAHGSVLLPRRSGAHELRELVVSQGFPEGPEIRSYSCFSVFSTNPSSIAARSRACLADNLSTYSFLSIDCGDVLKYVRRDHGASSRPPPIRSLTHFSTFYHFLIERLGAFCSKPYRTAFRQLVGLSHKALVRRPAFSTHSIRRRKES